jgi:DNA-directed RNA polymerase specialized sigma24 family protein
VDRSRLHAALNGDPDARAELGRWIHRELHSFFATFPRVARQDLIQDTAKVMFEKFDRAPDDPELFRRWMLKTAAVQARAGRGRKRRDHERAAKLQQHVALQTPTATLLFKMRLRSEQWKLIAEALERLPANLRSALEHHLAGRDRKSLAQSRGISVATADWLIWKATDVLRRMIHAARLTRPAMRSTHGST